MKLNRSIVLTVLLGAAAWIFIQRSPVLAAEAKETPIKGSVAVAENTTEPAMLGLARIPLAEAVTKATDRHAGKPLKAELADEDGFLVWEVELVDAQGVTHEVTVDAGDGKILKMEKDDADNEREGEDKD